MRRPALLVPLVLVALTPACEPPGDATLGTPLEAVRAHAPNPNGMPDLAVDAHRLAISWVVYDEYLAPDLCSVQEGNVPPGHHRTLRFTVTTPNIGDAAVHIGDPRVHIDPNGDGDYSDSNGLFEYADCHHHFHFRNYAQYELLPVLADGSLGDPVQARKRGFCMIDETPYRSGAAVPGAPYYRECGTPDEAGNQGISAGWADTYTKWIGGQYFVLTDPDEPVPPGEYVLRVTVNPGYIPDAGEPCHVLDEATGLCHNFAESNYANNVGQVRITVPDRVGKTGYGPGSGPRRPEGRDGPGKPRD